MTYNGSANGGRRSHVMGGAESARGHMCARCMNPYTKTGNPECVNAPQIFESQIAPYLPTQEFPESPHAAL